MSWDFWSDFLNSDKDYYEFEQPIDLATGKPVRYATDEEIKNALAKLEKGEK